MACFSIEQLNPLRGMRLLLVEDDFLIAQSLKKMLEDFGCEVVGPVPSLDEATRIASSPEVEGAVLDINVKGGNSGGIARALERRGAPYLFITGYTSPPLTEADLLDRTRLLKPIDQNTLRSALLTEFFPEN